MLEIEGVLFHIPIKSSMLQETNYKSLRYLWLKKTIFNKTLILHRNGEGADINMIDYRNHPSIMLPFLSQKFNFKSWGALYLSMRNPSLQSQILCKRFKYVMNLIGTFVVFYQSV